MLLDIIVIVLRETLEASILIAVLLSVSLNQKIKFHWLPMALLAGLMGAVIYGSSIGVISEWFGYTGQEVVNASLQIVMFLLICALIPLQWHSGFNQKYLVRVLVITIVGVALIREAGELFVFYGGYLQKDGVVIRALTSGFIGLTVGLSVGVLAYYLLAANGGKKAKLLHALVLTFIASGMVVQATQLLMQADWLPSSEPLWDSNWLIPESSIPGQIVYAIFGYEATPSIVEVSAFCLAVIGITIVANMVSRYFYRNAHKNAQIEQGQNNAI